MKALLTTILGSERFRTCQKPPYIIQSFALTNVYPADANKFVGVYSVAPIKTSFTENVDELSLSIKINYNVLDRASAFSYRLGF